MKTIFIVSLLILIVLAVILFNIYNNNSKEGFSQQNITAIQDIIWTSKNSMVNFIKHSSMNQQDIHTLQTNYLKQISVAMKALYSSCKNGKCTNVSQQSVTTIQNIIFANQKGMVYFIQNSSLKQQEKKTIETNYIQPISTALKVLYSSCNK